LPLGFVAARGLQIIALGDIVVSVKILAISGSASRHSKTALLVESILADLALKGLETTHLRLREIEATPLLSGDVSHPAVQNLTSLVKAANGILVATPIYKASFSGLLKAGLDVLPQSAFEGKAVFPIGTGGSLAHMLALDYGLRPVLQSMNPRHIVQSHFVLESLFQSGAAEVNLGDPAFAHLCRSLASFVDAARFATSALPHPDVCQPDFAGGIAEFNATPPFEPKKGSGVAVDAGSSPAAAD
jgi:FMN reductase